MNPLTIHFFFLNQIIYYPTQALTGEPDQIKKGPKLVHETVIESNNLLFFGTLCPSGTCDGIVVNIGDNTFMGRISAITTGTKENLSPIKVEINR